MRISDDPNDAAIACDDETVSYLLIIKYFRMFGLIAIFRGNLQLKFSFFIYFVYK